MRLSCSSSDTENPPEPDTLQNIGKEKTELQNQLSNLKNRLTLLKAGTNTLPKDGQANTLATGIETINTTIENLETNIDGLSNEGKRK